MANRKPTDLIPPDGVRCASVAATIDLGRRVGETLHPGDVLSLEGPLGAGKTQFVKGLVLGAGSTREVSSPTFALIHEYSAPSGPLFHFDLYRLDHPDELINIGFDDCLAEGVTIIEWGDRFPQVLPPGTFRLCLDLLPDGARLVHPFRP